MTPININQLREAIASGSIPNEFLPYLTRVYMFYRDVARIDYPPQYAIVYDTTIIMTHEFDDDEDELYAGRWVDYNIPISLFDHDDPIANAKMLYVKEQLRYIIGRNAYLCAEISKMSEEISRNNKVGERLLMLQTL